MINDRLERVIKPLSFHDLLGMNNSKYPSHSSDMIGSIIGDIVGSVFEHAPTKSKQFSLFTPESRYTDDTVLTIAIMDAIITDANYTQKILEYTVQYPRAGFSGRFLNWAKENLGTIPAPYESYGNGSAMRVAPIGIAFTDEETVLSEAQKSAEYSHAHVEGIKGAGAVALAVYLLRLGAGKDDLRRELENRFGYNLHRELDQIRPTYNFDVTCQGSVPEAIICFLESSDFEDAIRNAISLGGDADTQACIAGALAEAHYGEIPKWIVEEALKRLPDEFIRIYHAFEKRRNHVPSIKR